MPRYLRHKSTKKKPDQFTVKEYPEVGRWYIHRRRCRNEYLWPDGTIRNFTSGTITLGSEVKLKDWPGYFKDENSAKLALIKYNKAVKS